MIEDDKGTTEAPKPKQLISAVRVDILKPLGVEWDEVGPVLRRIRWAAARCMNAAMRACLLVDATKKEVAVATEADRAVREQLEREREYDPGLSVASAIYGAWAQHVALAYAARRKQIWRGDMSLPSYRKDAPIMVRAVGWDIERDGKGYVICTKLTAGRTARARFAVSAEGGSAHAILRSLVDPATADRHGDLKIKYDERKKRWYALLTVVRPKPPAPALDPARKLAVHRGMRALLTWATSEGKSRTVDDGGRVVAFKSQMHRRRRAWYAHKKNTPARARGRGSWRRYEQYRALEDKEERFMHTCLQQNAAAVVKAALAEGCGTIVLDDWSAREVANRAARDGKDWLAESVRSWPFAAQRAAIEWAARKAAIAVEVVASAYESITCPACRNVDAQQDSGRGGFQCSRPSCGLRRPTDVVAAWNMLYAANAPEGFEKNATSRKDVVTKLRAGARKAASGDAE